jgi:hypothetical protein
MNPLQKLVSLHLAGKEKEFSGLLAHLLDYIEQKFTPKKTIDDLINIELALYNQVAKLSDDEAHVNFVMQRMQKILNKEGSKLNKKCEYIPGRNISLVFHSASLLAHASVVQWFLSDSLNRKLCGREFYIIVMNGRRNLQFDEAFKSLSCKVFYIDEMIKENGETIPLNLLKLKILRDIHYYGKIVSSIWISSSPSAVFFFSARYALVQIFWTMKFHVFESDGVDRYVSCGSEGQFKKNVLGKNWYCRRIGFISNNSHKFNIIDSVKQKLPGDAVLLGTFARAEKISQPAFLELIFDILSENPSAHFIWTGRTADPRVVKYFDQKKILNRTHYIGWINTSESIFSLDIFLETIPYGCGLTAAEACSAGIPLVSMNGWSNFFGMHLFPLYLKTTEQMSESEQKFMRACSRVDAVGAVSDIIEYRLAVKKLIEDSTLRKRWGECCSSFYSQIINGYPTYHNSFYSLFDEIIEEKLSCQS